MLIVRETHIEEELAQFVGVIRVRNIGDYFLNEELGVIDSRYFLGRLFISDGRMQHILRVCVKCVLVLDHIS